MARRAPYPMRCLGTDLVLYAGRTEIGATGAVSSSKGFGGTITRSAAGVYLVTFDEKYPYMQSCVASCNNESAAAAFTAQFPHVAYSSSTGVLTITFRPVGGTPAELAEGAELNIIAVFQTRYILGQS